MMYRWRTKGDCLGSMSGRNAGAGKKGKTVDRKHARGYWGGEGRGGRRDKRSEGEEESEGEGKMEKGRV